MFLWPPKWGITRLGDLNFWPTPRRGSFGKPYFRQLLPDVTDWTQNLCALWLSPLQTLVKIETVRAYFWRNIEKVQNTKKTRSRQWEVYELSLWYSGLLFFITEQHVVFRKVVSSIGKRARSEICLDKKGVNDVEAEIQILHNCRYDIYFYSGINCCSPVKRSLLRVGSLESPILYHTCSCYGRIIKWERVDSDVNVNSSESSRVRGTVPAEISKWEKSVMSIRISTAYKSQTNSQRFMGRYVYRVSQKSYYSL